MNIFFNNLIPRELRVERGDIKIAELVRIKRTKSRIIAFKR